MPHSSTKSSRGETPRKEEKLEQIKASIEIERPVEHVFAFVADVTNMPRWQSQVIETTSAEPPALGATFEQRVQTPMRDVHAVGQITEFVEGRKFAILTAGGPMRTHAAFDFSEADGVTTVAMQLDVDATKAFKLALPVVARAMNKNAPESLATLKALLETEASSRK